jgi:hypothetical protein
MPTGTSPLRGCNERVLLSSRSSCFIILVLMPRSGWTIANAITVPLMRFHFSERYCPDKLQEQKRHLEIAIGFASPYRTDNERNRTPMSLPFTRGRYGMS